MSEILETILFNTSLASDIQSSGNVLTVAGMKATRKYNILTMRQIKYKAEVPQVIKVGYSLYIPTGATLYTIEIGDLNRTVGGVQEPLRRYSYKTPDDITTLGATAALQREAIHAQLVTKINNDPTNYVLASSLGTGTGVQVADDAGYYPVNAQNMTNRKGVSTVLPCTNPDGSGFVATDFLVTTIGVYSFGVGLDLNTNAPVIDNMYGNLIQGDIIEPPLTAAGAKATSGQNYDGFAITSVKFIPAPTGNRGEEWMMPRTQTIYVDNGTGTSTANLAGFVAFEREFLRAMSDLYKNDPSTIYEFFDGPLVASATYPTTGAAISTTDNVVMDAKGSQDFTWYVNPIGTHTLITPIVATGGLQPYLDVTTQEGIEFSPCNLTQAPKQFVVGKTEYSFYTRLTITGIAATDWKTLSIGFRKKAAYAVDQTAYEAASVATACLGIPLDTGVAPIFNMITGPGAAGVLTNTSTAVTPGAASSHDFLITVDINGAVRFYVNGVDKTPLLAAAYSFTAGLNIMPFISFRHGANVSAAPLIIQTIAIPSISWRL